MSAIATKLSSFLVAPTRVASLLDWKSLGGTVMSLDIGADRIGVAIAEHPSKGKPVFELDPIQIIKGGSAAESKCTAARQLEDVVKEERVCAFIINWPLQPDGRMGAPCGKVLHTLESLTLKGKNSLVCRNRPFTLWDERQEASADQDIPDEWGRLAVFGHAPDYFPDMSYSSKAQTHGPSLGNSSAAAKILDNFFKDNWQMSDLADTKKKSYGLVETRRQTPTKRFIAESTSIDEGGEEVYISQSLL